MTSYSTTYLSVIVALVAEVLKWSGIEIGSEALTTTILTLLQVLAGVWILIQRWTKGGVNALGFRK